MMFLEESLASVSNLEEGFNTLLDLNTAETEKELEDKDLKYFCVHLPPTTLGMCRYLSGLEASGWFAAITALLVTAREVAEKVE